MIRTENQKTMFRSMNPSFYNRSTKEISIMATSNRNNEMQHVSPIGTAKYPYLTQPDTKFDERGTYKVDLIITTFEANDILKTATLLAKEFKKEDLESNPARKKWGLHLPLLADVNQDGEDTGAMVARFKQSATIRTRDGREIKKSILLFDYKANRLSNVNPYSGTKMSVAYTMSAYANPTGKTYGVTFRLIAAQIVELVEGGQGTSAESLGFQSQTDGFVRTEQQDADDEAEILESAAEESPTKPVSGQGEEETSGEEVPF